MTRSFGSTFHKLTTFNKGVNHLLLQTMCTVHDKVLHARPPAQVLACFCGVVRKHAAAVSAATAAAAAAIAQLMCCRC